MRKLVLINLVSLDGFYEGPGEGFDRLDWHLVADEWNDLSIQTLDNTGTILFGRTTYEGFRSFWPVRYDPIARRINEKEKVVVSTTLKDPGWTNASVLRGNLEQGIDALKAGPGKQIVIYGSGKLAQSLTALGLIDEYHLAIAPVVLGTGTPLFAAGAPRLGLQLKSAASQQTGVIYAIYTPAL
jgi:dihydrofolate reductase